MANLDEYWNKIKTSESFQDLGQDEQEKVRQHLFDTYIQKSPSYQSLPQSQRISVKKHFDDTTKIVPETMGQSIVRQGKKLVKEAGPAIETGKKVYKEGKKAVDLMGPASMEMMPAPVKKGYEELGAVAKGVSETGKKIGEAIEPSEKKMENDFPQGWTPSTDFDVARIVASGAIKTTADFLASAIPTNPVQGMLYPVIDTAFKYAGTTFLGKELHMPGWKPKTGLSGAADGLGDRVEKIITQRRIENYARGGKPPPAGLLPEGKNPAIPMGPEGSSGMYQGSPRPLEVLAHEEAKLKAQSEIDSYEEWLKQADALSASGGEPKGDIHPEAKVNVTQLRDAAKERLQKLQNEPVRIESLGRAEDELRGYFRKQTALLPKPGEVIALTETTPRPVLQPGSKTGDPHALFAYNDKFGPGGAERSIYNVYGDPEHPSIKERGWGSSVSQEDLQKAGIPITGREPKSQGFQEIVPRETGTPMLPGRPAPAGLLPGATPPPAAPAQAFSPGIKGYKEFLSQAFSKRLPGESKQVVDRLSGTLLNALKDEKWIDAKKPRELDSNMMSMIDKLVDNTIKPQQSVKERIPEVMDKMREEAGFGKAPDKTDLRQRPLFDIVSDLGKNLGEKGQLGGGDIDPVRQAQIEENIKELVDRAMSLGYETTQDIMLYAAKNAPPEIQNALRKNLSKTLSPFDTHAYKEMEAARQGNPIAKKSLMDSSMRDYLKEKMESLKGYRKRRSLSKIIGQFHDGDEAKMRLTNDLFMHDHLRGLDAHEAAALRWHIEGKAPTLEALKRFKPEEEAKAMIDRYNNPTPAMKKAAEAVRPREDEWHDLMSEFYDSLGYADNYVTRRWKQAKEYLSWEGQTLGNRTPFFKGRKLLTQADGINAGLEPESFDIRDDIRAANDTRVRLLTRLHDLRKIASTFDDHGRPSIILEEGSGQSAKAKITDHSGEAPAHWLRYRDVPMLRGLAINPDYKPAMDFIFSSRYKGLGIDMYEKLGSISKASILGYSLFHPASLTEMLVGGISYRDVFTFNMGRNVLAQMGRTFAKAATADLEEPLNWKDPVKSIHALYQSFMSGHAALANRPLALDMAEHGFKLGSVDDVNYNILSKTLSKYEGWLKAREASMPRGKGSFKEARETVSGIREAGDILQKFIWDYQRPIYSMHLYEKHLADNIDAFNLNAPEGKKIPIDQIKFSTANFISKMVGGISMGTLLVTARSQQFLQWSMMAPDWTIGRALMPAAALTKGPEGRQARKLMLRMGLSYFVFGNLLNYHNSQKATGKGRWMWENDPGHTMEIYWKKDQTGRSSYFQPSKAFTEIYDDIDHPLRTAVYKLNPNIHAAAKLMQWATNKDTRKSMTNESPLSTAGEMFIPRTFTGQNAYGTFPVHKGISKSEVVNLFEEFHKTGDSKYLDKAMRYGEESGFDVESLSRQAKARYRHDERATFR